MLFPLPLAVGPTVQAESGLGSSQSGGLTSDVLQSLGFISPSGKLTQLQRMCTAEMPASLQQCASCWVAGCSHLSSWNRAARRAGSFPLVPREGAASLQGCRQLLSDTVAKLHIGPLWTLAFKNNPLSLNWLFSSHFLYVSVQLKKNLANA